MATRTWSVPMQVTPVEKRPEHEGRQVIWQVAARRSTYKKLDKRSLLYKAKRKIEKAKAQVRAKVEHPFRVIKRQFGYTKVCFRGPGEEYIADGYAVCSVESVDGSSTSTDERRRGASVMQEIAAAKYSQRLKHSSGQII